MSLKQKICAGLVALSFCSISAFAATTYTLSINNGTKLDATAKVNGKCSQDILGESGVIRAGTSKNFDSSVFSLVCARTPTNCKADVFMAEHCAGDIVAAVTIDTKKGVQDVQTNDPQYVIAWDAYTLSMTGGPTFKFFKWLW